MATFHSVILAGVYNIKNLKLKIRPESEHQYTSGYPVLVSSICKYIDEKLAGAKGFDSLAQTWGQKGIESAVKKYC